MSKLSIKNLSKSYKDKKVLENINLEIVSGEVVALIGLNGVGKTTLLKVIGQKLEADKGEVKIDGSSQIDDLKELMYIPDKNIMPKNMKIEDIIKMFELKNEDYNLAYVKDYLEFLNISKDTVFGKLSKGNQEIIQLAILISNRPKFLIMDEPLAAIDIVKREFLYEKIIDLQTEGVSIIMTSHIIGEIQNLFTRVLLLENGIIKEDKSLEQIYDQGYQELNNYVTDNLN